MNIVLVRSDNVKQMIFSVVFEYRAGREKLRRFDNRFYSAVFIKLVIARLNVVVMKRIRNIGRYMYLPFRASVPVGRSYVRARIRARPWKFRARKTAGFSDFSRLVQTLISVFEQGFCLLRTSGKIERQHKYFGIPKGVSEIPLPVQTRSRNGYIRVFGIFELY